MDGRAQRGERTRKAVAAEAAAIASVHGLAGMTLAKVATELGVSKSSIQAAYGTKEELQLAAVGAATDVFLTHVIVPALAAPEGLPRLVALSESWLAYIEQLVFPGGCFMGATLSEFDSRPGVVRDALAGARGAWLGILEQQAAIARAAGDLPAEPSAALVAFEVDALLAAANMSRNLSDDIAPLDTARTLIALRLGTAKPAARMKRATRPKTTAS